MSLQINIPASMPAQARRERLIEARSLVFLCQMRITACRAIYAGEAVTFYERVERVLKQRVAAWKAVQL